MYKKTASIRSSSSGVVKIRRDSYSTVNGMTKNNSWWELRKKALDRDRGLCVPCLRRGVNRKAADAHHIVPLSRGGINALSNIISVCPSCHTQRHPHNNQLKKYHGG